MYIAIIDYNRGNVRSVQKAFQSLGINAIVTRDPRQILNADGLVLPGVGAFKDCMENLEKLRLIDPILRYISDDKPFLGICLGLQLLFTESEEFGRHNGLDIIKGIVVRFPHDKDGLKVPHMGWNSVDICKKNPLFDGIPDGSYFYFVHSFHVIPDDDCTITSTTSYGMDFVSSVKYRNIYATQFHPEKSQKNGIKILDNFGRSLLK